MADRKIELHRKAVAALAGRPGAPDTARLSHHAEEADDADAVLRFAPAAAAWAATVGAHHEAAAQYARTIRFGERLSPAERAEHLEHFAGECFVTDQYEEGIAALEEALEYRRMLGDPLGEGEVLRRLSEFLWCPGRTAECERAARSSVAILEPLPPSRELASAYLNLASTCAAAMQTEEALTWAERARELAEQLGETAIAISARATKGLCESDLPILEDCIERAREAGFADQAASLLSCPAHVAVESHQHALAGGYLGDGLAQCSDRGLELSRLYLLADRARLELEQGRWSEAADSAAAVLRIDRTSTTPRIRADAVLGLVRARRGDPGVWAPLDEAWQLAEPTGELPRIGAAATARAEAAWLEGRHEAVADATDAALELAIERRAIALIGELACWRRRAGIRDDIRIEAAEPYAAELAGDWADAAASWAELGCPYEAALALAEADDEEPLRRTLKVPQHLVSQPVTEIVARRLRERGPGPATRARARRRGKPHTA